MVRKIAQNTDGWLIIVNPNAGQRKGEKDWGKIYDLLLDAEIAFKEVFTTHKEHAISITTKYIKKGYRKFMVVGGDGTLNEVINGIFFQKNIPASEFKIAMIPVGTGNDWGRMYSIPFNYQKAIDIAIAENTSVQDVGKVSYQNGENTKGRYFVNVAGMGYDAVVASKTNKDKERGRGGALVYLKNLVTSLLFYKHSLMELWIDGVKPERNYKTFSLSVGICRYNGGGMKQLPFALPNDGLFDITQIKMLGKFTVLKEVKNLYDGSFVNHPKVKTFTAKSIIIVSDPPVLLEVDGESLGHSPFSFELIPNAIRVVVPKAYSHEGLDS